MTQKEMYTLFSKVFGQSNILTIPTIFLKKLQGDYAASLFLSQLVYWSDKTKEEDGWIFKTYEQWESEIFIREKKLREIKKKLEALNLIETKIKKIQGAPTLHYRVKSDNLLKFLINENNENNESSEAEEKAETNLPKTENGNGENGGNEPAEIAETNLPKLPEPLSNIDYGIDHNIDYKNNIQKPLNKKNGEKKKSLREREACNDLERIEKHYLTLWDSLYSKGFVKTKNPLINWLACRTVLKKHLKVIDFESINKALDAASSDDFILQNGFNLSMILSANVLNRFLNACPYGDKKNIYKKSSSIKSDEMSEGDYLC